jgi:ketosteroid isomerase-like protein
VSETDFGGAVAAYRQALDAFLQGDPGPVAALFSRDDDVTLANPLGPPRRGPVEVQKGIVEAAAHFESGTIEFEEVSRYATPDLGYVVQLERTNVRLAQTKEMAPISLRATLIFRREGDTWRVAHRHADPITTSRPIGTAIQT